MKKAIILVTLLFAVNTFAMDQDTLESQKSNLCSKLLDAIEDYDEKKGISNTFSLLKTTRNYLFQINRINQILIKKSNATSQLKTEIELMQAMMQAVDKYMYTIEHKLKNNESISDQDIGNFISTFKNMQLKQRENNESY